MARNLSNAAASLLPYSTIEAAASGNVDAINAVLKHYERYIAALATRTQERVPLSTLLQRAIRASARKGSYHPIGAFPG